jgi:hypothetical protein
MEKLIKEVTRRWRAFWRTECHLYRTAGGRYICKVIRPLRPAKYPRLADVDRLSETSLGLSHAANHSFLYGLPSKEQAVERVKREYGQDVVIKDSEL